MNELEILWTETARRDLEAIVDYIAEDSVQNAVAVLDRIESRASTLGSNPRRGRNIPEMLALDLHQYREIVERPWRILNRLEPDRVLVVAVLDTRRDLRSVLIERLVRS